MLATLSFAWFFSSFYERRTQTVNIGHFKVNFEEGGADGQQSQVISVQAAFPRTFEQAKQAYLDGEDNIYSFEVENAGSLKAMFRLSGKVIADSNAAEDGSAGVWPLSGQVRYAVRCGQDPSAFAADLSDFALPQSGGASVKGNLFTTAQNAGNVSVQDYFNSLLLTEVSGQTDDSLKRYRSKEEYALNQAMMSGGAFTGGSKLYFQLMVWLDEDATVESTGVTAGGEVKTLQFAMVMHAVQYDGGAYFTHSEINAVETAALYNNTQSVISYGVTDRYGFERTAA